jgi:hypothetical protein
MSTRFRLTGFLALVALWAAPAAAHDPLLDLPEPRSVPEAWDVIRQSVDNVGTLLATDQLKPIAYQIANCSPAIRVLQADAATRLNGGDPDPRLEALFAAGGAVITATREKENPRGKAEERFRAYRATVAEVAGGYPPAVREAAVFNCPMHPLDRHLDPAARCTACSMKLVRRRIPVGSAFAPPGAASMTLRATPDRPLTTGTRAAVRVRLARLDGTGVAPADLLTMHTEKVHLLIVDPSLSDYHHEHPVPTGAPGEYVFAFTPRHPGPYRVFADVVPAATGVQEYVVADVPAADGAAGDPIDDRADRLSATAEGLRYELAFDLPAAGVGAPAAADLPARAAAGAVPATAPAISARRPVAGRLTVARADGRPCRDLEPVMGAYAHLVGFGDDRRTVVHIHPGGPEPTHPEDRGGPTLRFDFYAPAPGYYRLYAQVRVDGTQRFVPFGVNVGPAATTAPAAPPAAP